MGCGVRDDVGIVPYGFVTSSAVLAPLGKGAFLFSWKAGRERSAVLPPPRRLEMAIMLSMESMRQYCLDKNHPAAKKQPGEAFKNSFGPGTGSGPGAAPCVPDLAE